MKKLMLTVVMIGFAILSQAQIMIGGTSFQFPNGVMEWSDPVVFTMQSDDLTKEGIDGIPVEIRIKVKKKMMMACHYELEVKNPTDKTIKCGFYNMYTDATSKYIIHDFKLKPGEVGEDTIIYSTTDCKPKSDEDCPNCGWTLLLENASVK